MMRKALIISLFMLLLLFALTACKNNVKPDTPHNNGIPTSPADITAASADWILAFSPEQTGKAVNDILLIYIKDHNYPTPSDVVFLAVDGSEITMTADETMPGVYRGNILAYGGQPCNLLLKYNGIVLAESNLTMVHPSVPNFPEIYFHSQTATFTWGLGGSNQYQFAGVGSSGTGDGEYDEDVKSIPVTQRSYDVAANPVTDYGANTTYDLRVTQVNYKVVTRTALMSWDQKYKRYGSGGLHAASRVAYIRQLQKLLQKEK